MKPVDFDNTRRHLQIMLRGQELSPFQADQLKAIVTERIDPGLMAARPGTYKLQIPTNMPRIAIDDTLPPGTLEMRYGDRVVGRIENIGEAEA